MILYFYIVKLFVKGVKFISLYAINQAHIY